MLVHNIKKKSRGKRSPMGEMNMTPMIDVMLVLLVIFMITAPLLITGVNVDLPKASAPAVNNSDIPVVVFVDNSGQVFIGDVPTDLETLPEKLQAICENKSDKSTKIFVKGDQRNYYGKIMDVMGRINSAGFKKVVLVTEVPVVSKRNKAK